MGNEALIHEQLINQALMDNTIHISNQDLADMCKVSVIEVREAIQQLSDKQVIEVLGEGRYLVNFAKLDP
jgi:DNA-binding GntR family transcriptional regulator